MNNIEEDESWRLVEIPEKYDYLYPDQKESFQYVISHDGKAVISDAMGAGKTNTSLSIVDYLNDFPLLIVTPTSLKYNWIKEHTKWIKTDDKIKVVETSKDLIDYKDEYDIVICNYQILARAMKKIKADVGYVFLPDNNLKAFASNCFDSLLLDEAHVLKGNDSQTSQAIRYIAQGAPTIIPLTGTLMLNSSKDLFPILNLLDPENYNNYDRFCNRYCQQKERWEGNTKKKGAYYGSRNSEELHLLLKNKYMIRHTTKELKAMRGKEYFEPNIVIVPVKVKTNKAYNEAENIFGSGLNSGDNKKEALGKLSKLRTKAWELKKKISFEIIENAYEETEGKVVIYAHNKKVIADLKEKYKDTILVIDGDTETKDSTRVNIIEEFNTNPKIKYIAISIGAGYAGLDGLQFASNCLILLQEAWNPQTRDQIYARLVNREGQELKVTVIHVVAENTVEEIFFHLYDKKEKAFKKIIDGEDFSEEDGMKALFAYYKEKYK